MLGDQINSYLSWYVHIDAIKEKQTVKGLKLKKGIQSDLTVCTVAI